jgi:hypothetical protein
MEIALMGGGSTIPRETMAAAMVTIPIAMAAAMDVVHTGVVVMAMVQMEEVMVAGMADLLLHQPILTLDKRLLLSKIYLLILLRRLLSMALRLQREVVVMLHSNNNMAIRLRRTEEGMVVGREAAAAMEAREAGTTAEDEDGMVNREEVAMAREAGIKAEEVEEAIRAVGEEVVAVVDGTKNPPRNSSNSSSSSTAQTVQHACTHSNDAYGRCWGLSVLKNRRNRFESPGSSI